MAPRSPAAAASQMSGAPPAGTTPTAFPGADDVATEEIQNVAGTMVTIPSSKGRNTRKNRCLTSDQRPRRCSSIARRSRS